MIRSILVVSAVLLSAQAFAAPAAPGKDTTSAIAPKNNEMAPDFTAKGSDGKEYKLSQFKGKTVVLEWFNNDCPYVKKHYDTKNMQKLQEQAKKDGTIWLTIASSAAGKEGHLDQAAAAKLVASRGIASTALLLDSDSSIAKKYAAKTTPHMFIINKEGKVAYQGAIDDQPSANEKSLKGANNYVSGALQAMAKNEAPKPDSTNPYGCSVKY